MAWSTGEKPRGNEAGQTDGFWVLKEVWNVLGRWRAWSLGSLGAVWVRVDPRKPLLHAEEAQSWHDSQSYRSANQVAGFETTPGEFDGVGLQARLARRTPPERLPAQDLWAGADETHVVLPIKTSRSGNKAHREPEWSVRRRWVTPRGRRAWLHLGCQSGSEDSAVRAGRIDRKGWGCVCLSVCVSVCVCLYECVGVWGVYVYMFVEVRGQPQASLLRHHPPICLTAGQGFSQAWDTLMGLGWLSMESGSMITHGFPM